MWKSFCRKFARSIIANCYKEAKESEIEKVIEMNLPDIKTKEELVEFCNNSLRKVKHASIKWNFCGKCSLREICKPLAGNNYQKWKEDVFKTIILEKRRKKLEKLLS